MHLQLTILNKLLLPLLLAVALIGLANAAEGQPAPEQLEFFEKKVRPLLSTHCYECHSAGAERIEAGLLVDSRKGLLNGGDSGEAIVPHDADGSLLIESVRYDSYEMPPSGKLPDEDIETLERWVEMGAPWPEEELPTADSESTVFDLEKRKNEFWVWQPIQKPQLPTVTDRDWPLAKLDRFILAQLESADLVPADDADQAAIMRRLYFDLIGLPPSVEQVNAFMTDDRPDAIERLVDDLLDSSHFGERWGRHWLDLVRYAESRGHEFDDDATNAFQYRDYVIRAFNADVPYDQLVREHIAGDLLKSPRLHPEQRFNESILGTGFWYLGEWVHSPVDIRKDESDRFDNMIDVMSKTFLGVTVACARCHDHKFDAISTADYYSLSGFLQSSDFRQVRFESIEQNRDVADRLAAVNQKYQRLISEELARLKIHAPAVEAIDTEVAKSVVFDYASLPDDQFVQDGFIFGDGPQRVGEARIDVVDEIPVLRFSSGCAATDPLWNGLESDFEKGNGNRSKLSKLPRSGRTLRTPTFELKSGRLSCRVRGQGHVVACVDSHRHVAGPLHGKTIVATEKNAEWVTLNLDRYIGHRLHLEFTPNKDASLEVTFVVQGATKEIRSQLSKRAETIEADVSAFAVRVNEELGKQAEKLAKSWAAERTELQQQIVIRSHTAMAMLDGSGENDHILIRGSSSTPGKIEPRHFLTALAGDSPMTIESGSGRFELARKINDPNNPLTARVIVNRIWHHLMGRGIVPTTDDFGFLGQRPTHPELLDHLAMRFIDHGQSIKQMIRYVVLSRTYRMSSQANAESVAVDPTNKLWHHRPPKRLEGEAIRDALLAVSGRLDRTQFGEPVPIHLTSFMGGRGRPKKSGPLDGNGRRSIYVAVRRNFLSPFMLTFDTPIPFSSMGRRNVSNVPAQSLILMNDPFVAGQARLWAERVVDEADATVTVTATTSVTADVESHELLKTRIERMYLSAFARPPTGPEQQAATAFLESKARQRAVGVDDVELWADFAHALMNTKEFIFLK